MSFSFKCQAPPSRVAEELRKTVDAFGFDDAQRDAAGQYRDLAEGLLERFVETLGGGYGEVQVLVTGHANEGHKPTHGWADDGLTVQIQAVRRSGEP